MRHSLGHKKLNRTSEHRKALLKNMLNSLIKYEQITTTLPKAKFLKPQADKIITLGKNNTLQNTKLLISKLQDKNSITAMGDLSPYLNPALVILVYPPLRFRYLFDNVFFTLLAEFLS